MTEKLSLLQKWITDEAGQAAFLVPKTDPYQNEYSLERFNTLQWVSGFSGSAGFAIITSTKAAIFVDGRYTLQAKKEVQSMFTHHNFSINDIVCYIKKNLAPKHTIFFDPWLHTNAQINQLESQLVDYIFCPINKNPIWEFWKNRPSAPLGKAFSHPEKYSGMSFEDKKQILLEKLAQYQAFALMVTEPDALCWLLNIRGNDIPYCPVVLGFGLLMQDGSLHLFTNPEKVKDLTLPNVQIFPEKELINTLSRIEQKILIDPKNASYAIVNAIKNKEFCPSFVMHQKSIKNSTEIQGIKNAHIRDGAALTQFLYQLKHLHDATEQSASDTIDSLRAQQELFIMPSFKTISASGPNAALPHYQITQDSNRVLNDIIYLVDSGGQYLDGTTDITRTIAMKPPTKDIKTHFTLVLKGHIRLATALFPKNTCGVHLDALARQFLWDYGLDYAHGTGHGVGSFLNVHEGPCNISKNLINTPLEAGMILSNEPGYYKKNSYGIRIENLLLVVPSDLEDFYAFETLSLAPIDQTLIEVTLLTDKEKTWINNYHARVLRTLTPLLTPEIASWLQDQTTPL